MIAGSRRPWSATTCRTGRLDFSLEWDFGPQEFGVSSHILIRDALGRFDGVIFNSAFECFCLSHPCCASGWRGTGGVCRHPSSFCGFI